MSIQHVKPEVRPALPFGDTEVVPRGVTPHSAEGRKAHLGQFMTPPSVARFMAAMFPESGPQTCRLLDPGAGLGALSRAFLDRFAAGGFRFERVEVTAVELDETLCPALDRLLSGYASLLGVKPHTIAGDFIEIVASGRLQLEPSFTHAILNPPYRKIHSNSRHRLALRRAGVETVNLYSGFVALALKLLAPGGQLVAIVPRSFCNGPYYRLFRQFILGRAAVRHIHLFHSRSKTFEQDGVLQENVIIRLERGGKQGEVAVSTCTDASFADLKTQHYALSRIVSPGDPESFIHIPTSLDSDGIDGYSAIRCTLDDLGVQVSTGPVVDFRLREHLHSAREPGTVPLLYPGHFVGPATRWPDGAARKPSAIRRNSRTERWLYPNGYYCVVRRFTSKEQRRRIMANVVDPGTFPDAERLGFENHLNVYHESKHGLPEALARGLACYLNATVVDETFRRSSGHTQVNATDLRMMRYPSREALIKLGQWAKRRGALTQEMIDEQLERLST